MAPAALSTICSHSQRLRHSTIFGASAFCCNRHIVGASSRKSQLSRLMLLAIQPLLVSLFNEKLLVHGSALMLPKPSPQPAISRCQTERISSAMPTSGVAPILQTTRVVMPTIVLCINHSIARLTIYRSFRRSTSYMTCST